MLYLRWPTTLCCAADPLSLHAGCRGFLRDCSAASCATHFHRTCTLCACRLLLLPRTHLCTCAACLLPLYACGGSGIATPLPAPRWPFRIKHFARWLPCVHTTTSLLLNFRTTASAFGIFSRTHCRDLLRCTLRRRTRAVFHLCLLVTPAWHFSVTLATTMTVSPRVATTARTSIRGLRYWKLRHTAARRAPEGTATPHARTRTAAHTAVPRCLRVLPAAAGPLHFACADAPYAHLLTPVPRRKTRLHFSITVHAAGLRCGRIEPYAAVLRLAATRARLRNFCFRTSPKSMGFRKALYLHAFLPRACRRKPAAGHRVTWLPHLDASWARRAWRDAVVTPLTTCGTYACRTTTSLPRRAYQLTRLLCVTVYRGWR